MLFGNVHSVYSFQRLSNILGELMMILFILVINNYLDDLMAMEPEEAMPSALMSITCFLDILRIPRAIKEGGFQCGRLFEFLGVQFMMAQEALFLSTPECKQAKIIQMLQGLLDSDLELTHKALEKATGYATFAFQVFGIRDAIKYLGFLYQVVSRQRLHDQQQKKLVDLPYQYDISHPWTRSVVRAWIRRILDKINFAVPRQISAAAVCLPISQATRAQHSLTMEQNPAP